MAVRTRYQANVGGRYAALTDRDDMDAEDRWTNFRTATNEAAKEVIGYIVGSLRAEKRLSLHLRGRKYFEGLILSILCR